VTGTQRGHETDQGGASRREEPLSDFLAHLYDPTFSPAKELWALVGVQSRAGAAELRSSVLAAIAAMVPGEGAPDGSRADRLHRVLDLRYRRGLTQEETAEILAISPRHLRREQATAIEVLWDRLLAGHRGERPERETVTATDWQEQVRSEVAALHKSAPECVADVAGSLRAVVQVAQALAEPRGVTLLVELPAEELAVRMHPSALRQVLVAAITEALNAMGSGTIALSAQASGEMATLAVRASPMSASRVGAGFFLRELIGDAQGRVEVVEQADGLEWRIALPSVPRQTVLVVDDNSDLVHFYRRFVAQTRYSIVHLSEGRRLFQVAEQVQPDVIVLDVMLPDVDGWDLLTQARANPSTREVPIIVCSVVREAELAQALGATLYVPKPVRRQAFIDALDAAVAASPAAAARSTGAVSR